MLSNKFKIKLIRTYIKVRNVVKLGDMFNGDISNLSISEDDEKESIIVVGLPGVYKKDIIIVIKDNVLHVKINSKRYYAEMGYNKYWTIPTYNACINLGGDEHYDTEKIYTVYENGLLTIKIKKTKEPKKANKQILM